MAEAFGAVVSEGLDHLTGNLPALNADDIEPLHQARVAIRRLRSGLVLFEPYLEPAAASRFAGNLRNFGRALGPARDWDVFLAETLPDAIARSTERAWLERLKEPAKAARQAAHDDMSRLMQTPELTGFVPALAAWATHGLWCRPGWYNLTAEAISLHAPYMLGRLAGKAHKRGRHLTECSLIELHTLRKTIKKLRYGVEYLARLYPDRPVKPYRQACKSILEVLGVINDTVATDQMGRTLTASGRPHLGPAISMLARYSAERRAEALEALPEAWAELENTTQFWR